MDLAQLIHELDEAETCLMRAKHDVSEICWDHEIESNAGYDIDDALWRVQTVLDALREEAG